MGRPKKFKMAQAGSGASEDVKCPLCQKTTNAEDVKVYGTKAGRKILKLKCGHTLFR